MKINLKFDLPEADSVQDFFDDLSNQPHHPHLNLNFNHECHGFVDCLGQFVDYISSCFH